MSDQQQNVAVIGLGKIGLTLAAVFANNGFTVFGADKNESVVKSVNEGKSHVLNEPGLEKLVTNAHQTKTLSATLTTAEAVAASQIVIVIVPVLVDDQNNVDYQYIDGAVRDLASGIKKGTLVIFETTLPPGDTRARFGAAIEEISGLKVGDDVYLAYSPERVYSNRIIEDLKNYPKIVGGINEESLETACAFYQKALDCELIKVSSLETAEFAKVAECVYRDVNIALANELARFADQKGVKMSEVISASNSQPFSHIHQPGIGVGGHCIPIYPYFFINKGLTEGLTPLSRKINDDMAEYAMTKIEEELGEPLEGKHILILGLSYREDVKEPTKSTTLALIDQLTERKAHIFVHDPLFTASEISGFGVTPLLLIDEAAAKIEVVILQAYHQEYESINFEIFEKCQLVLDGRNKLPKEKITQLGIHYRGIGN